MPGRETDYERGFILGVTEMANLVTSGEAKQLDIDNVMLYANKVVSKMMVEGK